jgi:hypothetical protein
MSWNKVHEKEIDMKVDRVQKPLRENWRTDLHKSSDAFCLSLQTRT